MGTTKLFIEPRYRLELEEGELHPFTRVLKQELKDARISEVSREQRGYAVTWWEVVVIWVGLKAGDALIGQIMDSFVAWAKERVRGKGKKARPQYLGIYGPDGKVVKSVVVHSEDQVEDRTEEDRQQGDNSPPPGVDDRQA